MTRPALHDGLSRTSPARPKRRRRSREAASAEIVAAAEAFLRERPFRDLNVEEVMARTTLSRSAFYVYFRDQHDLLLRLVQQLGDALYERADRWLTGSGEPREDVEVAMAGVVEVYVEHGQVLRAISDAASVDPVVEQVYETLVERFVVACGVHIHQERAAGRARPHGDVHETSTALVWMVERYLGRVFGGETPRATPQAAIGAVTAIWLNAIYP